MRHGRSRGHQATRNTQVKPDEDYDWAVRYQGALRSIPLAAGALGICGVLANRVVSGVSGMLCGDKPKRRNAPDLAVPASGLGLCCCSLSISTLGCAFRATPRAESMLVWACLPF